MADPCSSDPSAIESALADLRAFLADARLPPRWPRANTTATTKARFRRRSRTWSASRNRRGSKPHRDGERATQPAHRPLRRGHFARRPRACGARRHLHRHAADESHPARQRGRYGRDRRGRREPEQLAKALENTGLTFFIDPGADATLGGMASTRLPARPRFATAPCAKRAWPHGGSGRWARDPHWHPRAQIERRLRSDAPVRWR